jgi:hypothetical protein
MIRVILGLTLAMSFGLVAFVQTAAAQGGTYDLPIQVINCPHIPTGQVFQDYVSQCEPGPGISFTVKDFNTDEILGSCETATVGAYAQCTIQVEIGSTVFVFEDATPEGYTNWAGPPPIDILEAAIQAREGPYAPFVNVLQQPDMYSVPVGAINCPALPGPDEFPWEDWQHACEPATGIRVVAQEGDNEIGSCVTEIFDAPEPQASAHCTIPVPYGSTVSVTQDVSTIPAGYQAVDPPVVVVTAPSGPDSTEQPGARFINVLGTAPQGGEEPPAAPELPSTGTGPTLKQLVSIFR